MTTPSPGIHRREAIRRVSLLLGGSLAAPTIAAVLAGCEAPQAAEARWVPKALSADQGELVATIAEMILPETDTPGARSTGVHRFIDTMLAEYYSAADRAGVIQGLADVDTRARAKSGKRFVDSSAADQHAVLSALDREAYASSPDAKPSPTPPFFRTMKELTLVGYYTSQAGATRELQHNPVPGRFDGCVPLSKAGRTWAV